MERVEAVTRERILPRRRSRCDCPDAQTRKLFFYEIAVEGMKNETN